MAMSSSADALSSAEFERKATLWLAIAVATLASMLIGILPLGIGMFADRLSLSLGQTGVLASAVQIGLGIGGLAVMKLRRVPHWRLLTFLCAMLAAVLNALTALAHSALALITVQLAAAVAGGYVYGMAIYITGRVPQPDRAFGLMYSVGLAGYSVFAALFPFLQRTGGFPLALNAFGAFMLIAGVLAWFLPNRDRPTREPQRHARTGVREILAPGLALCGLILFELGVFAVWAYTERIGKTAGFSPGAIGAAVAIAGIAGVGGALTAASLNLRLGRLASVTLAVATILAGDLLLWSPSSFLAFALGCCLFSYGWLLALPYFMGAIVALDEAGTLTSLILPAQTAGAVLGPAVAALAVEESSTHGAVAVSIVACLFALAPLAILTTHKCRAATTVN